MRIPGIIARVRDRRPYAETMAAARRGPEEYPMLPPIEKSEIPRPPRSLLTLPTSAAPCG